MSTGLIDAILSKMPGMNKWRKDFFRHAVHLFLCMRGRHNFENMERYGSYDECSYRLNFEKPFDFALFNRELIRLVCGTERIAAFDPSYLAKSGKHTPGVGWHWSGSAGHAKWGIEIGGLAVVDVTNNTAMHLRSTQTPDSAWLRDEGTGLLEHYADVVCTASGHLSALSVRHLAVDAYFAKRPFVDMVLAGSGLHVITRLRDDTVLRYRYTGPATGGKGRPREFAGRVDVRNPDPEHFTVCCEEPTWRLYEAVVHCKAFKRWLKVAVLHELDGNGRVKRVKIYASTDLQLPGHDVFIYYKCRFQIEFLYRDAKGHTGLEHCQSRNDDRMGFHHNLSLTAVNVAKATYWYSLGEGQRGPFSIADIKAQLFNELMLERIFCVFGKDADPLKNHPAIVHIRNFGVKAAA
jgi:DDE superfamily endonuclease